MAQLGGDYYQNCKTGDDTFGINEEDWNIYLGVTNYESEEEEVLQLKLTELENELRELDSGNSQYLITRLRQEDHDPN